MRYPSGEVCRLGDVVELADGTKGVVVCSLDTGEFTDAFKKKDWEYLDSGVLIDFQNLGIVHYKVADTDLVLFARNDVNLDE